MIFWFDALFRRRLHMVELCMFVYMMFFIASSESRRWPSVGKYKVDLASFESLALPELQVSWFSRLLFVRIILFYEFVNKIACTLND